MNIIEINKTKDKNIWYAKVAVSEHETVYMKFDKLPVEADVEAVLDAVEPLREEEEPRQKEVCPYCHREM